MGRCQLQRKITAKLLYNKKTEIGKKTKSRSTQKKAKRFEIALIFVKYQLQQQLCQVLGWLSGMRHEVGGGRRAALSSRFVKLREASDARAVRIDTE